MIERLEGEILAVGVDHLLVGLAGLGVKVLAPRPVTDGVRAGQRVLLHTRLLIRDGDPKLYGFLDPDQRFAFDSLIAVSGVGPRIALMILSSLDVGALVREVEAGRPERLLTVPGVGRKLAGRIALDLKGKLAGGIEGPEIPGVAPGEGGAGLDAVKALTALGYPLLDSREAVRKVLQEKGGEIPPLDALLREALLAIHRTREG
ncbi:MAG: Holliday junction branch migration protein RuvA [Candidatus Eisenbacteria bacterium]|nr:Holliday junction branch migration protein RuvA [Candidatus Eisenbacteria bacterium]